MVSKSVSTNDNYKCCTPRLVFLKEKMNRKLISIYVDHDMLDKASNNNHYDLRGEMNQHIAKEKEDKETKWK